MTLRAAAFADLGFVHRLTSDPANTPFMGDDDEVALAAYLTDPACRLLIWEDSFAAQGFALYREIGNASGRVELFRLALATAGAGQGGAFMTLLIDYAFNDLGAERLWLDASAENPRAHIVYCRAGFAVEGKLRQHWYRPALGRSVDMVLYGMLRAEWAARRG